MLSGLKYGFAATALSLSIAPVTPTRVINQLLFIEQSRPFSECRVANPEFYFAIHAHNLKSILDNIFMVTVTEDGHIVLGCRDLIVIEIESIEMTAFWIHPI